MKTFVQAQLASQPRTEAAKQISLFYAVFLTIMVVAQLFSFDTFIELIFSFNLPLSDGLVAALPAVLVACEVFALPFLLRMTVSPAFRWVSMACGWLVSFIWIGLTAWLMVSGPLVETVGFFGTVLELVPGWWAVLLSVLFGVMAAWASWGLLPVRKAKK